MSRLDRLSARAYAMLTSEQRRAVDLLRYENPPAVERGELKTVLGWKRSAAETAAYASRLVEDGMTLVAAANHLGVDRDHLRRLLRVPTPEGQVRKPSIHLPDRGLTDKAEVVARPGGRKAQGSTPRTQATHSRTTSRRLTSEGEADAMSKVFTTTTFAQACGISEERAKTYLEDFEQAGIVRRCTRSGGGGQPDEGWR